MLSTTPLCDDSGLEGNRDPNKLPVAVTFEQAKTAEPVMQPSDR